LIDAGMLQPLPVYASPGGASYVQEWFQDDASLLEMPANRHQSEQVSRPPFFGFLTLANVSLVDVEDGCRRFPLGAPARQLTMARLS
jgi:hypothetical protein